MMDKSNLRSILFVLPLIVAPLIAGGCSGDSRKEENKKARAEWQASLEDSIKAVQAEIDSCQNNIQILHDKVGSMLNGFVAIDNAREVEGYTIRNGWQGKYPLQSTGIVARIALNEGFEIISASQGAPYQQIEVRCGNQTMASDVVPHDQGLNYRRGNLTTVLFTGEKADSIGKFIADNSLNDVTLVFLGKGGGTTYRIPHSNLNMIADTWNLYSAQKEAERLEREIPRLNQKINILRQTIEREKDKSAEETNE